MFASALHCHHEKARAHFPRHDLNPILDQRSAALLLIEESVRRGFFFLFSFFLKENIDQKIICDWPVMIIWYFSSQL